MPSDPPTFRGTVVALDAATGDEVWRFHVTDEAAGEGAGVSVWSSPAVDPERGVLYIGTGQAYSLPAPARSDSLVALDLRTGEEVWHRQFTAGDAVAALPSGSTPTWGRCRTCSPSTAPTRSGWATRPGPTGRSTATAVRSCGRRR